MTRRPGVQAVASLLCVLVAGSAVLVSVTAGASADRSRARSASQWLARQLADDGTLQNPLGGALPDHGLMIDTLFALHASGDGRLAEPIVDYLDGGGHASDFFTWDGLVPDAGFEAIIVGGAAAKVLVAAEVAGRDPRSFGGYDMVAETRAAIMRSGPDRGRVSDYSKKPEFADYVSNNANMFGQALAVIGLAGVGETDQLAIDTMLSQHCSEGYFRIFFGQIPTDEVGDHVTPGGYKVSSCDEGKAHDQSAPDGDSTGLALSAMLAARSAGAGGLDAPIDRTVAWLRANQSAGGGWGGGVNTEAPNTNSTGLIVQALAEAGTADAEVSRGISYLKGAQAAESDAGSALAEQIGAIAYDTAEYEAAKVGGLVGIDTWIRATAQAALGLSQVGFHALTKGQIPVDPPASPTPTWVPTPTPTTTPKATPTPKSSVSPSPTRQPTTSAVPSPRPPRYTGGTAVPVGGSPPETGAVSPAGRLGRYLAAQLVGGERVEVVENGQRFVDYDATADLVLALRALGEQPVAAARASSFLLGTGAIQAYAHGAPYEKGPAAYAEPLSKLQVIARFAQTDGAAPADLASTAATLAGDLAALRSGDGSFVDTGELADRDQTVRRHAWAMLATAAAGATVEPATLDLLVDGQCTDGTFPAALTDRGCSTGDPAATAAAVVALNARPTNPVAANPSVTGGANPTSTPGPVPPVAPGQLLPLPASPALPVTPGPAAPVIPGQPAPLAASPVTPGPAVPVTPGPVTPGPVTPGPVTPGSAVPGATEPVGTPTPGVRNTAPAGWSSQRARALQSAAAALAARSTDGLIRDPAGNPDLPRTALAAAGRQAVGLDATDSARALGALLRTDGGLGGPGAAASDLPTSIAAAPGVAGRWWSSAAQSPVTMSVRLPLTEGDPQPDSASGSTDTRTLFWLVLALMLTAGAVFLGRRQLTTQRNATRKAVTS